MVLREFTVRILGAISLSAMDSLNSLFRVDSILFKVINTVSTV